MLSSNTSSSPCGGLLGLRPMLLPNLTQNKEVEDDLKLLTLVLNNQMLSSNTSSSPCGGLLPNQTQNKEVGYDLKLLQTVLKTKC